MASTLSTLAPLGASQTYTSKIVSAAGSSAVKVVGTVFADKPGTLIVQQSYDQLDWDVQSPVAVNASAGQGFSFGLYAPYIRVLYTNGAAAQTAFRLYVDLVDGDGNFVTPQPPSDGGAFIVLRNVSGNWQVIGRFDGNTGWDACATAAIQTNQSGKYAAFDISLGVVAQESVQKSTEASATSF